MNAENPINKNHPGSTGAKPRTYAVETYMQGIRQGNRTLLSQAITLLESTRPDHQQQAQRIVEQCLPHTGHSIRIGITGVPGVGKSTFIEALGLHLIKKGKKLAVLTVDPTSSRSKGSILGDKTRMGELANAEQAFIRPSPTAGSLGGVTYKSRESILLCEAAGYDTIFIETVGVGQSETAVHSMVDFFLLLMLAGAGDELQGIKRGIVEMADLLAINKADSLSAKQLRQVRRAYKNALHLYPAAESGWDPKVVSCSGLKGTGIEEIWEMVEDYYAVTRENGYFEARRNHQARHWMYESIHHQLKDDFYQNKSVKKAIDQIEQQVTNQKISSFKAAQKLLALYHRQ